MILQTIAIIAITLMFGCAPKTCNFTNIIATYSVSTFTLTVTADAPHCTPGDTVGIFYTDQDIVFGTTVTSNNKILFNVDPVAQGDKVILYRDESDEPIAANGVFVTPIA